MPVLVHPAPHLQKVITACPNLVLSKRKRPLQIVRRKSDIKPQIGETPGSTALPDGGHAPGGAVRRRRTADTISNCHRIKLMFALILSPELPSQPSPGDKSLE